MNWILASGSPRRRELLEMLGVPNLTIRPAKGPERATPGAGPEQTVRELALHKAQEVAQTCAPEDIVIAADTIVYLDGVILGKPKDTADAARMLAALSGREHTVYTGVAVLRGGETRQAAEHTAVRFRTLTPEEIASVELATGAPESLQQETAEGLTLESTLGTDSPEERMVEHIALREAIDQLPEREKMTILLRFFKGLTQEQTARILGVSQVQISRLERRGLADLRRLLDG